MVMEPDIRGFVLKCGKDFNLEKQHIVDDTLLGLLSSNWNTGNAG